METWGVCLGTATAGCCGVFMRKARPGGTAVTKLSSHKEWVSQGERSKAPPSGALARPHCPREKTKTCCGEVFAFK